jgi:hypothetical protein
VLTKYGLADTYKGCEEPDGEDYNVEAADEGPRPFYCLLDAGLKRTSTGSKTFGALKVRSFGESEGGGMWLGCMLAAGWAGASRAPVQQMAAAELPAGLL